MNGQNQLVWKNGTNELCWRDAFWTPATGFPGCDGVPVAKPAAPNPMANKVTFNADTFFDFDKSIIKPEGKKLLDQIAAQVQTINLEAIIAVGHTDWIGTAEYNLKLSQRRAAAVKAYLVSKGVDANRITTEGKGKANPIADNRTAAGRAKNRRVEIEIVGSRK
jgi:OOP family OmpA-OmpF porin